MAVNDRQFSVRYIAVSIAAVAIHLRLARLVAAAAVIGLGLVFFLSWFALSFFLLTRPPEFDPALRAHPGPIPPFRWRLLSAGVTGMVISLLVMMWAARGALIAYQNTHAATEFCSAGPRPITIRGLPLRLFHTP